MKRPEIPTEIELSETTRAIVAADEAHMSEALGSAHWERRGFLQKLVRTDERG